MGAIIRRLYLNNYKTFDKKEIVFSNNYLSVFDGPNGYGKTSIFDAIEFLVTGKISRIIESDVISGNNSYETVFLAKNKNKDVLIKGEFFDSTHNKEMIIGISLKANSNGKKNNPKSLLAEAHTYILPSFEIAYESWNEYLYTVQEMERLRKSYFGEQNLKRFTLLHYIRQENRLSYFEQSEANRTNVLKTLIGVEEDTKKQQKVERSLQELRVKIRQLDNEITNIEDDLKKKPESEIGDEEYIEIMGGKYPWDYKDILFQPGDEKLLHAFMRELDAITEFIKYQPLHRTYNLTKKWDSLSLNKKKLTIKAWILLNYSSIDAHYLENRKKNLDYLESQYKLINEGKLLEVPYVDLSRKLHLETLGYDLYEYSSRLQMMKKSQNALQNNVNLLMSLRTRIHDEYAEIELEGRCPYCGKLWEDRETLERQYLEAENSIRDLLDKDGNNYNYRYAEFNKMVETYLKPAVIQSIKREKSDLLLRIYCLFDNREDFSVCVMKCDEVMTLVAQENYKELVDDLDESVNSILKTLEDIKNGIPDEYLFAESEYKFEMIRSKYFTDSTPDDLLTEDVIKRKKRYLHNLYMKSFDGLTRKLKETTQKRKKADKIEKEITAYNTALKNSIQKYEKQIIDQIEIPFFIYSSRLLQSYHGGQGVLMSSMGKTIRFVAPGSEHDVLYTLSSGQLSAVLLSFSLAMNKIYSGDGIKTIYIDDPIQCMDDINMISFVELLRSEFGDNQIIISTHEEHFSDYIRYKYKKYNIETQAITLKDA